MSEHTYQDHPEGCECDCCPASAAERLAAELEQRKAEYAKYKSLIIEQTEVAFELHLFADAEPLPPLPGWKMRSSV